jgi:hypothetical protein
MQVQPKSLRQSPVMPPIDEIFRQKIEQARRMTPEERVVRGLRHSDDMVEVMANMLRGQMPNAGDQEIRRVLRERIDKLRRLKGKP